MSSKSPMETLLLTISNKKKAFKPLKWCPQRESNLQLKLTMLALCHLTMRATKQYFIINNRFSNYLKVITGLTHN